MPGSRAFLVRSTSAVVAALAGCLIAIVHAHAGVASLRELLKSRDLTFLADVKHGARERVLFYSSEALFADMAAAGVRHVAVEMPRVLGRQALTIETEAELEIFAQDVLRSQRWHFTDPSRPDADDAETQLVVARAMGRQVLLARKYGLTLTYFDFNNPLGGFQTYNDPVYRCLVNLTSATWLRYGLDSKVSKADRDAAIMRERFSHDKELAEFISRHVAEHGGGRTVVIGGYAHAVLPGGLAFHLERALGTPASVIAMHSDAHEQRNFEAFLAEQARLLQVDLSVPADYTFRISDALLTEAAWDAGTKPSLDGSRARTVPAVCEQIAQTQ